MAASILLPGPTLPKLSTNIDRHIDLFSKITCHFPGRFLAIFPPEILLTFFGHSLLSYSKRRHLSTSRVIPRPLSYHPYHMMTSYDTASICQSMLVENDVRMGVPFWVHKELSKSYREGTAQKLKSMALPYKTKVRKK